MIRWAAAVALVIASAAVACSDEPQIGPEEGLVVHGPAASTGDATPLQVVTYRRSFDGRVDACFGTRGVPAIDGGTGSCLEAGVVRELDTDAFARTSGPQPQGLVTSDAAIVRAHLSDGTTVDMKPYPHPDLDADVFAFTIPEEQYVTRIVAVSASGDVLGSMDPP